MRNSVVNFSEVKEVRDFRIDAEYWHPDFIENDRLISHNQRIKNFVNKNISNIKSSPIKRDFEYLEISRISLIGCEYQTAKVRFGEEPDRAYHILQKKDVVVSTVRPNRNAVALIEKDGTVGSSGLCVLRAENIEPEYLFAFCKTGYFIKCLMRANKATMYPAVSNSDVLDAPIFAASGGFRKLISQIIQNALNKKQAAEQIYAQAKSLLFSELNLIKWQEKHQLTFVKNYSDTEQAGRIDAEYFQPKYEEIVNVIKDYSGGWDRLGNLAAMKDKNFVPKSKQQYKYIELANIAGNGEITDCMTEEGQDLPTRARRKVSTGDVIVSSIEGSLSSIALIGREYNKALCSTGFHVINSESFNSETLLVLLKSMVCQLQLKKACSGTILTAINKDEFGKIILPKIQKKKQTQIGEKVREAFELRKQSNRLLKCAKQAVEIAIEKNEKEAVKWLEKQQNKFGA